MDVLFIFVYTLLALCTVIQCSAYCAQSLKHLKNGNLCIQYFIYLLFFLFYVVPIVSQTIFVGYEYEVFWRANDAMMDFVSNIEYLAFVSIFSYFIMKSSKKDAKMQNSSIEINHSITRFGSLAVVFSFVLTIALSGIEVLIGGYGYAYINSEVVNLNESVVGIGIIGYLIVLGNLRFVSRTKIIFLTTIVFCFFWIVGKRYIIAETMIMIICVLGTTKYISGKKMVQYLVVAGAILLPLCFLYGLLFKENVTSFLDYFNVDFSRQYTLVYQFYCDRIGRDISINPDDGIAYLSVSRYLGYQGNSCNTWNMIAHFYDGEQKYISSVNSYFYRRIGVPDGAKYMKVTILEESYPTDLSVQYFMVPTHCSFKNIKFENNRCVGLAQSAMKDMLVENCEFTKCGQSSAKCAYDAEDGWDMMQDVTFRKLNFHDNPNNDFLTCAGHNFVIEDMIDGKVHFWERTNSYVVRNCDNLSSAYLGHTSRKRSGYIRFCNNTINGNINIEAAQKNDTCSPTVKDCNIYGRAENTIDTGLYLRCNIGKFNIKDNNWNIALGSGNFKDCTISNKSGENMGGTYENCAFENIRGNIHGTFNISNSTINNWVTYAGAYDPSYNFTNCELNNFEIIFGYWHQGASTLFNNCNINNEDFLLKLPHYSMKKPVNIINSSFTSNGKDGMIVFYDDRTGGSAGELVEQDILTIENNKISLNNSQYVVNGIGNDTVNNINIAFRNNELLSEKLQLYDKESKECENIKIIEK